MLDTCSFVERYSLYNWVGDRRRVVADNSDGSQSLTPAGEVYAHRYPTFAFNRDEEVIPAFTAAKPSLSGALNGVQKTANLTWLDYNGVDMTESYEVQQNVDDGDWATIMSGENNEGSEDNGEGSYADSLVLDRNKDLYYRLKLTVAGADVYSNEVRLDQRLALGDGDIRYGASLMHDIEQKMLIFPEPFRMKPIIVFGGQSNENRAVRTTVALPLVNKDWAYFKIAPWLYQSNPQFSTVKPETLPYIVVAQSGHSQWGTLPTEAGTVSKVTRTWKAVSFKSPFSTVPAVFVNPASTSSGVIGVCLPR